MAGRHKTENKVSDSHIVRVVSTYRVKSASAIEAREIVSDWLNGDNLPNGIKAVGKTEVIGLRGLL